MADYLTAHRALLIDSTDNRCREFAAFLKESALLHWIVTAPEDIRRANFLTGDGARHFNNLERFDVQELRAVSYLTNERGNKTEKEQKLAAGRQPGAAFYCAAFYYF